MCGKIFSAIIVLIALLMALLVSVLPPERLDFVIGISRFFEVMIPVLGVGALLKYLCGCPWKGHCDKDSMK